MPGLRRELTMLLCALLCLPCAVLAEEPSQLLELNNAEPIQASEEQQADTILSSLPNDIPQFDGDRMAQIHVEDSPWAFFVHPQQSPHGGLLGKRFFSADYIYGRTDGSMLPNDFLNDLHGFAISLNSPVTPGDGTQPFAMDVFVGYSHLFGRDRQNFPAGSVTGHMDSGAIEPGVTFYTNSIPRLRPFAQVGYHYNFGELKLEAPGGITRLKVNNDRLLLKFGTEFDLSSKFVIRVDLDVDDDEFDESTFTGQLIFSPNDEEFFRIGGFTDLDGFFSGFLVGGGVKF